MNTITVKDIQHIANMLKNRPELAKMFAEAIGISATSSPEKNDEAYINAKTAGAAIGKSSKWMKEHASLFDVRMVQTGKYQKYMFKKHDVITSYNNYIMRKSICA